MSTKKKVLSAEELLEYLANHLSEISEDGLEENEYDLEGDIIDIPDFQNNTGYDLNFEIEDLLIIFEDDLIPTEIDVSQEIMEDIIEHENEKENVDTNTGEAEGETIMEILVNNQAPVTEEFSTRNPKKSGRVRQNNKAGTVKSRKEAIKEKQKSNTSSKKI